jgi:hypothetical protein
MSYQPGNDMKPTGKIKPNARRQGKIWKKLAALPRRMWAVGGVVALAVLIAWFMLVPARREAPKTPPSESAAGTEGILNRPPLASAASPDIRIPEKELAFIQAIRLQPSRPPGWTA